MFIVINCLGMPFNGDTIKEKSLGGSETAAYYMAKELVDKGHKVTLFTNTPDDGVFDGVRYLSAGQRSERFPMGERFHHYAESTPHDVCIVQRHPHAFRAQYASKINLWWVHDLAQIRMKDEVNAMMWNVDGVLTVSEYHKKQICDVYGMNPDNVFNINNGVDLSLFEGEVDTLRDGKIKLLYSSRPERGLEHLVCDNGIMDRLAEKDSKYHLYVCAYDNVTQEMAPYYDWLNKQCEKKSNVTILGALTKQELADTMRQCDAMVYPTPGPQAKNFEEVSCITAMECMAAGLPFISTAVGALPETCEGSGSKLYALAPDGLPDLGMFAEVVDKITSDKDLMAALKQDQLKAAKKFDWSNSASNVVGVVKTLFSRFSHQSQMKRMMRDSDIYALEKFVNLGQAENAIEQGIIDEFNECYDFALKENFKKHYEEYYEYEKERGVEYGPESLDHNDRFEYVSSRVADLPAGSVVLDYGCAHGHYTVNLAKRFPQLSFVGIDIAESNIEKARAWAESDGVKNCKFYNGEVKGGFIELYNAGQDTKIPLADFIIAAEVIEHIAHPQEYVETLSRYAMPDATMCVTVPYGPWEGTGYKQHWPWRAHLWHFERADLHDMWGHLHNFNVVVAGSGKTQHGESLGSHIVTWTITENDKQGEIDYERKFSLMPGKPTVSLCMIVKDAESTIKQCLDSVVDVVDEINISIDKTTGDDTWNTITKWISKKKTIWPIVNVKEIPSPIEIGFDEARNLSIEEAAGDWIMWLDADETMVHAENLHKFLRNNQYDGYAISQHHIAAEPLGVLKTDLPCRLFRNNKGIKFYGVVHEHPEKELNKGAGHVQVIHDVQIMHNGYTTEEIRRKRFDRNIGLLERDREKFPDRILGKFLWIRDLAQSVRYALERNGGRVEPWMRKAADEGIAVYDEVLRSGELRIAIEALEFYSDLARLKGTGFDFAIAVDSSKLNGGVHLEKARPVIGHFAKQEHLDDLIKEIVKEKTEDFHSRYF